MPRAVPIDRSEAWSRIRKGFLEFLWVPTAVMLVCVVLALITIWLDGSGPGWAQTAHHIVEAHIFREAQSTNSFLSMLTTGLITMTSITFSMLLLALQQSASLIAPQVVYSFLMRRRNQTLMGFFLGATIFVLLVHASTHEGFNPVLGAALSLLLAAAALYALLILVFTAVNQMRPQTVIGDVRTLTLEARRHQRELLMASYRSPRYFGGTEVSVRTERHGYVRDVDVGALRKALGSGRGKVEVEICIEVGNFVAYGDELARARAERPDEARRLANAARGSIALDYQRSVRRDPAFGVEQLHMIGWSSASSAYQNPGISMAVVRNLRDILARWAASYAEVEGSEGTLPLVYPDGLVKRVLESLEALAVVSTESLQQETFVEVLQAYRLIFPRLPEQLQARGCASVCCLVTALGDLVLTPQLENALERFARTLLELGHADTANVLMRAKREMASRSGALGARSTRAQQASSAPSEH